MSYGELLRKWRISQGLTQTEAGERVGVSQSAWSDYERETIVPGVRIALRIEAATGGEAPLSALGDAAGVA